MQKYANYSLSKGHQVIYQKTPTLPVLYEALLNFNPQLVVANGHGGYKSLRVGENILIGTEGYDTATHRNIRAGDEDYFTGRITLLLTCNAGTFSDADADTENTSARTFVWYRNANAVSGQNASTLNLSSYLKGDNISCQETATNTTWHASNASATSANATLVNSLPSVSVSSPVSYALLNSSNATLQISAVANGLSIDQCWYQLDNGATHSISACSSATLLSLSNDVHNLTAYANDTDGNVASALRVFFVDAAHFVLAPFLGLLWCFQRLFIQYASMDKDHVGSNRYIPLLGGGQVIHNDNPGCLRLD